MTKQAINIQIFNDPGLLYNADQQCQLSHGDGAKYCKEKSPEVTIFILTIFILDSSVSSMLFSLEVYRECTFPLVVTPN